MKKNNEKKINWKNVAIIGGVFAFGVATGVVGGKMLLEYIIKNDTIWTETTPCMFMGKPGINLVMKSEKARIELLTKMPRSSVEGMLDMIDGKPLDWGKFFGQDL